MQDRRKIAGISKETYLDVVKKAGGNVEIAALDYDIRQCIASKVELLADNCMCRQRQCEKNFIKKARVGNDRRLPISWASLVFVLCGLSFLIGAQFLPKEWIKIIFPFI